MRVIAEIIVLSAIVGAYGYVASRKIAAKYYTLINLAFAILLASACAALGVSSKNLGLDAAGAQLVLALAVIVLALFMGVLLVRLRRLRLSKPDYNELFLRIPFGTALAEELVFRGSIMGILLQNYGKATALLVSSLLFSLWHLLPVPSETWANQNIIKAGNPKWLSLSLPFLVTVSVTFAGGLVFGWLRLASGALIIAWAAHTLTNITGWLAGKDAGRPAK